jgi:Gpi18-like mannosyltransferase
VTFAKRHTLKITALLLAMTSVALRIAAIPITNRDMFRFNIVWYKTLYKQGIAPALATNFANYTPPYTYFLALATFTRDFISPLTAIKLIPTCFDLLGAFLIYKIVKLKFQQGDMPLLAAAIYFIAPTVMINSSYWGQADSLYTSCLLACLYLLMIEKPFPAMLSFGMAFTFKAQAVFFIPFLFILTLRKKIHWLYFGLIPLVYLVVVSPVVLLGRPLLETLLIYTKQSNTFDSLTMNAPNLYYLLPREWIAVIVPLGILIAIMAALYWANATAQSRITLDHQNMIFLAFTSVALMPYLLPKMHDRYFYPADVLAIALAVYMPSLWFIPILYQITSATAVAGFLFNINPAAIGMAALLNSITLAFILKKQRDITGADGTAQKISPALSWVAAILTPAIMSGFILSILLTPYFLRMTYALPYMQPEGSGFNTSERFHWASETTTYLGNDKKNAYLTNLEFENGRPVFNDYEIALIDSTKQVAQGIFTIARVSLLGLFVLALLAWAGDRLPALHRGIKHGGWLAIGLGILIGLLGIFVGIADAPLESADTLARLLPIRVLQYAALFTSICLAAGGFALTKIMKE